MTFPERIFNMKVRVAGDADLRGYPIAYTSAYRCLDASIGGVPCIVVEPNGDVKPLQASKMAERIEAGEGRPCVLFSPKITAYQRRGLSERGVAWMSSEDTFHIPFLAAACKPARQRMGDGQALSAGAQQIAVNVLDGTWDGLTSTQIAEAMGKSLSSVSGYLAELSAIEPGMVGSRGRTRFAVSPLSADGRRELMDRLEPHLSSPVRKRTFLALGPEGEKLFRRLPLSGVSALSRRTMIADDPWETRAAAASDKETIARLLSRSERVTRNDSPDALLETWLYDPREDDGVSLYLDVRDLAAGENDERLDQAVDDLKRAMFT